MNCNSSWAGQVPYLNNISFDPRSKDKERAFDFMVPSWSHDSGYVRSHPPKNLEFETETEKSS